MVHLLPHQQYDLYQKAVHRLNSMSKCLLDHSRCCKVLEEESFMHPDQLEEADPEHVDADAHVHKDDEEHGVEQDSEAGMNKLKGANSELCPWKRNHGSKASLKKDNTIMNVPVTGRYGVPAAGLQVITRRTYQDILANDKEDVEDKTDKKLLELTKDISDRLTQDVFTEEGREIIEKTRIILDLPSLAVKIRSQDSALKVALVEFPRWHEAVEKVGIDELDDISVDELKSQFKLFITRLKKITDDFTLDDLKKVDAKVLIKKFFDEKQLLYQDIEIVLQAMAVASVKHSCESILESFVSKYENHFDERRNVDEVTANEEFEICVNGPNLAHAESVVKDAMDIHWKNKPWHFFRSSGLEKLVNPTGISKTIRRLIESRNKLSIMD